MGTTSTNDETPKIEYCLYARKSSEDDERQAMSIESQIKEMTDLATKDGVAINEARKKVTKSGIDKSLLESLPTSHEIYKLVGEKFRD